MSKLLFIALAPLLLVSPAAATDLMNYDNGYAPEAYVGPDAYAGYPGPAYERPYVPPDAYIRYPAPAYEHPNYRDVARYCEPDAWAIAEGYVPPTWCFPEGPTTALDTMGLPAPSIYGRNYPTPGYASRRAPPGRYGNYPYRASHDLNSDYPAR
jgi:hypothetical protein